MTLLSREGVDTAGGGEKRVEWAGEVRRQIERMRREQGSKG